MYRGMRSQSDVESDASQVVRKSERAYFWLRDEILSFGMQPGTFIDKVEVCEKLGVSKQPVTAALTRLEQEGLVEIYPERGTYVARLRLGAMRESLFVRGALETAAVRRLAEADDPALRARLDEILAGQVAAIEADDTDAYFALDRDFHMTLARALPYPQVAHQVDLGLATIRRCQEPFRPDLEAVRASHAGHRRIAEAIAARDGDAAAREMEAHVESYTGMLLNLAEARPELFVA